MEMPEGWNRLREQIDSGLDIPHSEEIFMLNLMKEMAEALENTLNLDGAILDGSECYQRRMKLENVLKKFKEWK